jgi:hypothetical protein
MGFFVGERKCSLIKFHTYMYFGHVSTRNAVTYYPPGVSVEFKRDSMNSSEDLINVPNLFLGQPPSHSELQTTRNETFMMPFRLQRCQTHKKHGWFWSMLFSQVLAPISLWGRNLRMRSKRGTCGRYGEMRWSVELAWLLGKVVPRKILYPPYRGYRYIYIYQLTNI